MENRNILGSEYSSERKRKSELKFRLAVRAKWLAYAVEKYAHDAIGLKILDFGAAEGRALIELNRFIPGNKLIGIEYSQELINVAPVLPMNITLLQGDVTQLPDTIEANTIDVVSALALLEHLESPMNALLKAYNVLKPGGLLIATCPVPAWDAISVRLGLLKGDQHVTDMDKQTLLGLVDKAGFSLVKYQRFMWAPISFLPYLKVPVTPESSVRLDRLVESFKLLNWLFVNQIVVARKP